MRVISHGMRNYPNAAQCLASIGNHNPFSLAHYLIISYGITLISLQTILHNGPAPLHNRITGLLHRTSRRRSNVGEWLSFKQIPLYRCLFVQRVCIEYGTLRLRG